VESEVIKEVDIFDAPDMRLVDIKNFYVDPTYFSLEEAPFVVEKSTLTYNQMIRMANKGIFDKSQVRKLKDQKPTRTDTLINDDRFSTSGFSSSEFSDNGFEVFEFWGLFEIEEELEIQVVATLVNDEFLRFERTPFKHMKKPYIMAPYIKDDQSIYGLSMYDPVYKEILASNTIKNQIIDRTTQSLCNMWLKSRAAGIKARDMKYIPNGVIETNSMNGLMALRPNESSMIQGLRMLEYFDVSIQKTTGATDMLAGTETDLKRVAAFAVRSSLSEGALKLKAILENVIEFAVKPAVAFMLDLNAQFSTKPETLRVLGNDGLKYNFEMTPDQIRSDYEIEIYTADELIQDNYQVQNMVNFMNMLNTYLPLLIQTSGGKPIQIPDISILLDKIWKRLGFKETIPKVTLNIPQAQPAGQGQGGQIAPAAPQSF
jgi:hypothetical protein